MLATFNTTALNGFTGDTLERNPKVFRELVFYHWQFLFNDIDTVMQNRSHSMIVIGESNGQVVEWANPRASGIEAFWLDVTIEIEDTRVEFTTHSQKLTSDRIL